MYVRRITSLTALAFALACAGEEPPPRQAATGDPPPEAPAPRPAAPSGAIDQQLASQGETLFQSKGCIGCHTLGGGRLTGPDLAGVTQRRSAAWIIAMVVNPDSMLKFDPEARKLFAEYMTPMMNMGVTRDDARALYEFLRTKQ